MNERLNRASVLTSANAPTPYTETTQSYVFALRVSWACVGPVIVVFLFFFPPFSRICMWVDTIYFSVLLLRSVLLDSGLAFQAFLFLYSFITSDSGLWKVYEMCFLFCFSREWIKWQSKCVQIKWGISTIAFLLMCTVW